MREISWRGKIRQIVALFVAIVCTLALFPMKANAADEIDVFYGNVRANNNEVYGVRVGTGKSLTNIRIGAERVREAGYNAYIVQDGVKSSGDPVYCIMIGVFENEEDAEELLEEVWNGPKVRGVQMQDAYIGYASISDRGVDIYSNWYYE